MATRKTYKGKKRPAANREHRVEIPKTLQHGILIVHADVHIREWRRDGKSLIVVPTQPLGELLISGEARITDG